MSSLLKREFIYYYYFNRYKKLLSSVDLTKDFFYSYTYPVMQCLQRNITSSVGEKMPYDNIFVWNAFLTQAVRSRCNNTLWTIALVHGHFKQVIFALQNLSPCLFANSVLFGRVILFLIHSFPLSSDLGILKKFAALYYKLLLDIGYFN